MGAIALQLEAKGIPTSFVIFEDHEATFLAQAGLGGYGYIPVATIPVRAAMDQETAREAGASVAPQVIRNLTQAQPEGLQRAEGRWVPVPEVLTFSGDTFSAALDRFNRGFLKQGWSDGLPLVPPTRERVSWLLKGSPLPAQTVLGKMGPSFGQVTVEKLAVNAAMAGARPEHMPVIIAAMQAILSYPYDYYGALMRGVSPLVIVNGPIAAQIGLNSSASEMGPNPRYPAGAAIGRAINLAMRNLGGFGRGLPPAAQHGQPGLYTGLVIAESQGIVPWPALSEELGQPKGANTVTVLGVTGSVGAPGKEVAHAASFVPPSIAFWPDMRVAWQRRAVGVLLMTPFQARRLAEQGVTKADIRKGLYELARVPRAEFERIWAVDQVEPTGLIRWLLQTVPADQPIPIAGRPDNFLVVVAGGWDSSLTSAWLFTDMFMSTPAVRPIALPPNWAEVLADDGA